MNRPGVRHVPEGGGEQKKKKVETGCEVFWGVPMTLTVTG